MQSDFSLQIVNRHTGEVVTTWEPGSPVEATLIQRVADVAVSKGVGFWRTEATVRGALIAAWFQVLTELKSQIQPPSR